MESNRSKYFQKHYIEEDDLYGIKVNCNYEKCGGFFAFDLRLAEKEWSYSDAKYMLKVYCPYCGNRNRYIV